MNKIILIIQREFLTRVRKKTFIIGTILFPLLYLGLIFGTGYIADKTRDDIHVALIDRSGLFTDKLINAANGTDTANTIKLIKTDTEKLISDFDSLGYDGYVVIPQTFNWRTGVDSNNLSVNTKKNYGIGALEPIEKKLNR
ncbi:MAG TPA: ABC transporter permease, partial [Ferruginibacter sp.]|nr:ABC transporter permease [Ferruginibacter sp.]